MDDYARTTEIMARDAKRDVESFGALYERIAPALLTWSRLRIRPSLQVHLGPEDLVQDVFWRAFTSFGTFDPEKGSFRSWVFTIATRRLLNCMRDLRVGTFEKAPAQASEVADTATRVSQRAARNEAARTLYDVIMGLSEEDRALVLHCGLEGLPTTEAAGVLGVGEEAARKRWQRLREKLRGLASDANVLA